MTTESQRREQQEWAKAYGPSDNCVQIGGLVFEVTMSASLIADKINAAIAAERQRRDFPNCDFYTKMGITLLDAKWLDPECHEGCQSLKFKNKLLSAQATIEEVEQHNILGSISPEALAKHDAEVRKPLVEALEDCLAAIRHEDYSSQMRACIRGDEALTKVKEGK